MRRLIRRIHFLLALFGGLLLSIVTASGALSVFRPELDRWQAHAVEISHGPRADLDGVAIQLEKSHPGVRVERLLTPAAYGGAVFEWTLRDDRGTKDRSDDETWKVFTDPVRGTVAGSTRESWVSAVVAWIARFHHNLWLGDLGSILVGGSGFCLFFFILSGLCLWWPGLRRWRQALRWRWRCGSYVRQWDIHVWAGMLGIPLFLLIALTGTMFAFRWMRTGVHAALGGSVQELPINLRPQSVPPSAIIPLVTRDSEPLRWESAAQLAEVTAGGSLLALLPPRPGPGVPTWNALIDHPANVGSNSGIAVRMASDGNVLAIADPRHMGIAGKMSNQLWGLHVGTWGGLTGRVLHVLTGLLPPVLLGTGVALWWLRHRRRQHANGDLARAPQSEHGPHAGPTSASGLG